MNVFNRKGRKGIDFSFLFNHEGHGEYGGN